MSSEASMPMNPAEVEASLGEVSSVRRRGRGKKSLRLKKSAVTIGFEPGQLLELSRVMFVSGLTFHQFFGYLVQQIISGDERLLELIKEAQNYKKQRILEGKEEKVDAATLYRMIEEQLNVG